ncbi:MAG: HAMP domain-containing sensor histidine kinase [Bacteroidota bacterium]
MKLSTKTSLNFLSFALFTFLFAVIAFYLTLRFQVDEYINSELLKAKKVFFEQVEDLSTSQGTYLGACQLMPLKSISAIQDTTTRFQDTLIFDEKSLKYLPYRQMTFNTYTLNSAFEVKIIRPLEDTDNLIINIFLIITALVIVLIIALLIINKYSSNQIWKDFYISLDRINKFDLNLKPNFELPETEIKEFEDLNSVLVKMNNRISNDYLSMKEYTENASHEIQTPLAIINAKLEQLLQCKDLPERQMIFITEAYEASNRLAQLNKTLILLARIENRQYPEIDNVNITQLIQRHIENYEEIIQAKGLKLLQHIDEEVILQINPYLGDILFLNLIKNAIRHNVQNGTLKIELSKAGFTVSNSGESKPLNADLIFNRFYKSSKSSKSIGLGLSIVKKISELFDLKISYSYGKAMHIIHIEFPERNYETNMLLHNTQ